LTYDYNRSIIVSEGTNLIVYQTAHPPGH